MRKAPNPQTAGPQGPAVLFPELAEANKVCPIESAATDAVGEADSLSLGHNSNDQRELPFKLSGSQRKTAYALEQNCARLCLEAGIERIGFLTLTVGDLVGETFEQIWEPEEASRRINSLITGLLSDLFVRAIIVTERHKSGAIHFHLVVETAEDIRGGFDFAAFLRARTARKAGEIDHEAERAYEASATPALRALWGVLRDRLPGYGFGRAELTPIFKTGEAISRYVGKYVEKNLFNRRTEDKRKKLVRYMGWGKSQMKPNEFCWSTPKACEWRRKASAIASTVGLETPQQVRAAIGPRWAYRLHGAMFDLHLEGVTEWHEGEMTRDQVELAREFMRRDAQSWEAGKVKVKNAEEQRAIWDRALTAAEVEELARDMEAYRVDQLARGFTFEAVESEQKTSKQFVEYA